MCRIVCHESDTMKQMWSMMLALIMTVPLPADTYYVERNTYAGQESTLVTYIQGHNYRFDGPGSITIFNAERQTTWSLDRSRRQYMELSHRPAPLFTLAKWIVKPRDSGKTVHIYYETADTGERKDFFGYTASHVITRERTVAEPGACALSHEIETDGWYINAPGMRSLRGRITVTSDPPCRDQVIRHGEPASPGFAVALVRGSLKQEVLELSSAPLDPNLFEVPADYKRTEPPSTSWVQDFHSQWRMLQRAVETWFE